MHSDNNRARNCLMFSNIQPENIVSDTFDKVSQKILDKILQNPLDTSFDIVFLISIIANKIVIITAINHLTLVILISSLFIKYHHLIIYKKRAIAPPI